jgi:predicted cupin superfamily sugar epimerase
MTPPPLARALGLAPHPEGGWYRRIYTSPVTLAHPAYSGADPERALRSSATLIHYLLGPGEESAWHTVASDEVWLWQQGGPLLLQTSPPGPAPGPLTDHHLAPGPDGPFHAVVPAGHWQRARPTTSTPALVACMVTPGFDFADFTLLHD